MNVIVEIESAHAEEIARRFQQCEPEGKKNWILKNKGILVGKQVYITKLCLSFHPFCLAQYFFIFLFV